MARITLNACLNSRVQADAELKPQQFRLKNVAVSDSMFNNPLEKENHDLFRNSVKKFKRHSMELNTSWRPYFTSCLDGGWPPLFSMCALSET